MINEKKVTVSFFYRLIKLAFKILAILLILILVVTWLFQHTLKGSVVSKLEDLTKLEIDLANFGLDYQKGGFVISTQYIVFSNPHSKQMVARIDDLNLPFFAVISLFYRDYRKSSISLEKLTLNLDSIKEISLNKFTLDYQNLFYFIDVIRVEKIILKQKSAQIFDTEPILAYYLDGKFYMTMYHQNLSENTIFSKALPEFNIKAVLDVEKLVRDRKFSLSVLADNSDIKLHIDLEKDSQNKITFMLQIPHIKAMKLIDYLPDKFINEALFHWLKKIFKEGELTDIKVSVMQEFKTDVKPKIDVRLYTKNVLFNFDDAWPNLENFNANIHSDGKKLFIHFKDAKLNVLAIDKAEIYVDDLLGNSSSISAIMQTSNRSEQLLEFLKLDALALNLTVLDTLFLSGNAKTYIQLKLPLNKNTAPDIRVMSQLKNNRLMLKNPSITIDNINGDVIYFDKKLGAKAKGIFKKKPLDLDWYYEKDSLNILATTTQTNLALFTKDLTQNKNNKPHLWQVKLLAAGIGVSATMSYQKGILSQLHIHSVKIDSNLNQKNNWQITPNIIPDMFVNAHQIHINDYLLPDLQFRLMHDDSDALLIEEGYFTNKALGISFHGKWSEKESEFYSTINHDKLSLVLKEIGISESVKGGKFKSNIHFTCSCAPWNISLNNIVGEANIHVEKGVLNEKDIGNFGRILSVLNINALKKRLKLNFSDVIAKGFEYDNINTNLKIEKGMMHIEKFKLLSSSSNIDLTGKINLLTGVLNLEATVIPSVSGSLPVLTYLLGTGAVGLAIWTADQLLFRGEKLDSVLKKVIFFDYTISGNLDNPIIQSKNLEK